MLNKCLGILGGAALLAGLGAALSSPSQAQPTSFYCDTTAGYPRTIVNTGGTSRVLINWETNAFAASGYDNYTRCQMVSGKFQALKNSSTGLGYITAGIVNGQSVICATGPNGRCDSKNMLFTVRPGVNASSTLQQLFDVRDGYSVGGLLESEGRVYINLEAVVNSLQSGAGVSQPEPATNPGGTVAPAPESSPSGGGGSAF